MKKIILSMISIMTKIFLIGCFNEPTISKDTDVKDLVPTEVDDLDFIEYQESDYPFGEPLDQITGMYKTNTGINISISICKFDSADEASTEAEELIESYEEMEVVRIGAKYIVFSQDSFMFFVFGFPESTQQQVESVAKATGYYP